MCHPDSVLTLSKNRIDAVHFFFSKHDAVFSFHLKLQNTCKCLY